MVRQKLSRLKANKASGPDEININILRKCLDFDIPLSIIFNKSIASGWRDANVVPIYKKGTRTSCNNYRPISLTSQIVKILERLVLDQMTMTLKSNNFFNCHQHGFQDQSSCITQLLECLQDWTTNYDNKVGTDIVYLDFSKAFDKVPHIRLCHKLEQSGIRGNILLWLKNFLTNRKQRVLLRNGASNWLHVTSGVPQGSILGPTLFLIYVNDIPEAISTSVKLFADDTKIYNDILDKHHVTGALARRGHAHHPLERSWIKRFEETYL